MAIAFRPNSIEPMIYFLHNKQRTANRGGSSAGIGGQRKKIHAFEREPAAESVRFIPDGEESLAGD
jgi:hypothetical protein